ncbi:OmpH family outer membrane protein [Flavicella sediminum]|uniref:OmpH family outer membrane protein n=1 Tax=Flavicella sediminum TaxID=2585141 RepID=UPI00111E1EA7|nr:OmpH family outer membrane protein [Flavicella sediminum]
MVKNICILLLLTAGLLNAQKPQTIAYVDMEYILESIPAYQEAQKQLDNKVAGWRSEIEKREREIESMKADLSNEKILLTEDLILDREENIEIKDIELKKMRATYFGVEGSLFELRQQLVKPIQNEVYNAIQKIIKRKKYDFVFDRSSDLIMLHANKKYDISKTVIAYITKSQKELEVEDAKIKKATSREALKKRLEEQKKRREERVKKVIHR